MYKNDYTKDLKDVCTDYERLKMKCSMGCLSGSVG